MELFKKTIDGIAKAAEAVCMAAIAALAVITVLELVRRGLSNRSYRGAVELCDIIFLWMAFMGLIPLYHDNGLIRLDFLVGRLKGSAAEAVFYLNKAFSLMLGFSMAAAYAVQALTGAGPACSIPVPFAVRYIPMALAGAYIAAATVYQILDHVRARRESDEG